LRIEKLNELKIEKIIENSKNAQFYISSPAPVAASILKPPLSSSTSRTAKLGSDAVFLAESLCNWRSSFWGEYCT